MPRATADRQKTTRTEITLCRDRETPAMAYNGVQLALDCLPPSSLSAAISKTRWLARLSNLTARGLAAEARDAGTCTDDAEGLGLLRDLLIALDSAAQTAAELNHGREATR